MISKLPPNVIEKIWNYTSDINLNSVNRDCYSLLTPLIYADIFRHPDIAWLKKYGSLVSNVRYRVDESQLEELKTYCGNINKVMMIQRDLHHYLSLGYGRIYLRCNSGVECLL